MASNRTLSSINSVLGTSREGRAETIGGVTPEAVVEVSRPELVAGLAITTLLMQAADDASNGSVDIRIAYRSFEPSKPSELRSHLSMPTAYDCIGINSLGFGKSGHGKLLQVIQELDRAVPPTKKEVFKSGHRDREQLVWSARLSILQHVGFAEVKTDDSGSSLQVPVGIVAALLYAERDAANPVTRQLHDRYAYLGKDGVLARSNSALDALTSWQRKTNVAGSEGESEYWHSGEKASEISGPGKIWTPSEVFLTLLVNDIEEINDEVNRRAIKEAEF